MLEHQVVDLDRLAPGHGTAIAANDGEQLQRLHLVHCSVAVPKERTSG
jgi:hypothetical protein